jgi:hypothetical protein
MPLGSRTAVADLEVCGQGRCAEGCHGLGHGLIEDGGDNPAMDETGIAFDGLRWSPAGIDGARRGGVEDNLEAARVISAADETGVLGAGGYAFFTN